jgi:uncharacterized membrane protein
MSDSISGPGLGIALLFAGLLGCSGADPEDPGRTSESTGASCPSNSTLTYEGWASGFFESYCTGCHSTTRTSQTERRGAPIGANWDDLDAIREFAADIDAVAASGPKATNRIMPPSAPAPSDEERRMLGEWLACGAPD